MPYLVAAVVLSLLVRLPYLVNPERMNSDHAFLGLQGLRLLGGDFSLFLWGSEYQASFEPTLAAILFAVFGSSYQVLQLEPLLGFLGCLAITFIALRREVSPGLALVLCLPIIFATQPFIHINVWPYRQWSIFFALIPLALSRKTPLSWFLCGFFPFFSLFVDFFTIQFIVPLALFFWFLKNRNTKALMTGVGVGAVGLLISRAFTTKGAPLAFAPKTFLTNMPLFLKTCFPVMAGVPFPVDNHATVIPSSNLQWVGLAGMFLLLCFTDGAWKVSKRPLVIFGSALCVNSLLGFWGSSMASDVHAVRYLSPLIYAAPFGLLAYIISWKRTTAGSLIVGAFLYTILSWQQASPLTKGFRIQRDPGAWVYSAQSLKTWLLENKTHGAYSEYWRAYQLNFLYQEHPLVIPRNYPDRYAPYKAKVESLERVAEIFTPDDTAQAQAMESQLRIDGKYIDKWELNGFVGLIRRN